ncbi:MAG: penicillin-binding protein [Deltaproteobacteria bacterium]|nr:MAG: penicillin-binding protein [Deltaproteobacteria bacterium]
MGLFSKRQYTSQTTRLMAYERRRRRARLVGRIFIGLFLVVLLAAAGLAGYVYYHFSQDLPDYTAIRDFRPHLITRVYAKDGRVIGEFYAERRIEVPYSRLPWHLVAAFVAAEDARFFEHPGVDFFGIVRAFIRNLQAGEIVQGGSTITQQIVKSILLTSEKSYSRKIREAILAYRIDNYLSKEQIINLYLNHIYLGHGAYGVEAAAQEYFGKHVEDLDLAEAALLAGLPKAPSRYSPYLNPLRAQERQVYVLNRMVEAGFIRPEEARQALNQPLTLKSRHHNRGNETGYYAEYVRQYLENKYGRNPLYQAGFRVYTPADVDLHRAAQEAIKSGLDSLFKRHGYRGPLKHLKPAECASFWARQQQKFAKYPPRRGRLQIAVVTQTECRDRGLRVRFGDEYGVVVTGKSGVCLEKKSTRYLDRLKVGDVIQVRLVTKESGGSDWLVCLDPDPMAQAALVYLENRTGKVRVLMGGKDFDDSPFNRAVQAKRQPGSAFKPIIYAAAVEKGYGPHSMLLDAPLSLPGGKRGELWTPKNYDGKFFGPTPLATALARSRNIPTIRLLMSIGLPQVMKVADQLGIESKIYPNYSSALGSSEVTLLELTRAYSVFPNQGQLVTPIFIERVEDRDGRILEEHQPYKQPAISPRTAQIMTELLVGVVQRGTGRRVMALKRPIGGKTGTTNQCRDAWFIGFTPAVTAGVWVGMDDEQSLGSKETGSQAAAPIFIDFMREALKNQPVEDFPNLPVGRYARNGSDSPGYDDEIAVDEEGEDLDYWLEERRGSLTRANSQSFFKRDLEE